MANELINFLMERFMPLQLSKNRAYNRKASGVPTSRDNDAIKSRDK